MRAFIFVLFFGLAFIIHKPANAQEISINEIMASNASVIPDEDGDFSDWIELFNNGENSVNLAGYGLSDNYNNPFKWVFPEITLQSGEFLLVFASGKNKTDPSGILHTSYSISAAGEEILLTKPNGTRIDEIASVSIPTDISYGRLPDSGLQLLYFDQPTPGYSNANEGYLGFLSPPTIQITKISEDVFELEIEHNDNNAEVFFTLNGAAPDTTSLLYSSVFTVEGIQSDSLMFIRTTPIEADPNGFGWHMPQGNFPGAVVVRSKAFRQGYLPSETATKTKLEVSFDFPVVSIAMDSESLFDDSIGIYVPGNYYNELGWNYEDYFGYPNANYYQDGAEWERAGNIEFIYPDGNYISQAVGFRIHGGRTRVAPMKSLRVYARSEYGTNTLDFDVFGDGVRDYKRLLLRNSGQDFYSLSTLFRDAMIHALVKDLNFDTQKYKPALLFINGEFWGVTNLRERFDKYYLGQVYNVDIENVDILRDYYLVIDEGDRIHFQQTLNYINNNGLQASEHFDSICTRIDVDNYMNYQIANIYANNCDWPGNNMRFWRLRTDNYQPDASYGHDGRWRWMMFDTDFGFGLIGGQDAPMHDMLDFATTTEGNTWANPPDATLLLRKFLENETFKVTFINRFADLLNSFFKPERVISIIDQYASNIEEFMPLHINRWGHPVNQEVWQDNLELLRYFAIHRPENQRQHLRNKFELGPETQITLEVSDPASGYIKINSIKVNDETPGIVENPYPWTGIYFQGVPLQLEAIPLQGYIFAGWEGLPEGSRQIAEVIPNSDQHLIRALFAEDGNPSDAVIHYWHFNDLPSGNITLVSADSSLVSGALISYPGTGSGYMDRVNEGSTLNGLPDVTAGYALRVRNPSDTRELIIKLPTTGYEALKFSYAVVRTNNGQRIQRVFYRINDISPWVQIEGNVNITENFQLFEFDLTNIEDANNNDDFHIKITFHGTEACGSSGNNRFDNMLLQGKKVVGIQDLGQEPLQLYNYPNPFAGKTTIKMRFNESTKARLELYNILGEKTAVLFDKKVEKGIETFYFDSGNIPSGSYILKLSTEKQTVIRRILLSRV
ncbi:MAG: CotH kinase family protein [Bacteroidales bacterium]|nr:CotH kinase family protein [Bacteroidales bacterium]